MPLRRPAPAAFSLVELLIVVAIMGIVAALALPSFNPAIHDQLQAAAQIVATDLAYGRSLAVANNSTYRFRIEVAANRYVLEHSGNDAALDVMPPSPFRASNDPPKQHIVDLDSLPRLGGQNLRLANATTTSGAITTVVTNLEFGTLGETTRNTETTLWLAAGLGDETRYMSVAVNPVTGLATIGDMTSSGPSAP